MQATLSDSIMDQFRSRSLNLQLPLPISRFLFASEVLAAVEAADFWLCRTNIEGELQWREKRLSSYLVQPECETGLLCKFSISRQVGIQSASLSLGLSTSKPSFLRIKCYSIDTRVPELFRVLISISFPSASKCLEGDINRITCDFPTEIRLSFFSCHKSKSLFLQLLTQYGVATFPITDISLSLSRAISKF